MDMAALERWAWFGSMVKICQLYSRTLPLPILRWSLIPLPLNLGKCVICLWPRQHEGAESACFRGCTREGDAAAPSGSATPACLEPWATAEAFHRPEAAMLKGSPSQPREEALRLWEEGEILGRPPVFSPPPTQLQARERPWARTTQLKLFANSCPLEMEKYY